MTEGDWDVLLPWNQDPDVLWFSEGADIASRTLEEAQGIYRQVSGHAFVFVAEVDGRPIGECWLQEMNLPRILELHPGEDVRRIDLTIGEKELGGRGFGTRIIGLLARYGFEACGADRIYGLVLGHNPRSRRAFEKNGFVLEAELPAGPGRKYTVDWDLVLVRTPPPGPGPS